MQVEAIPPLTFVRLPMAVEACVEVLFDGGPFGLQDGVEDIIPDRSIFAAGVMADGSIFFRAECFNRLLGSEVQNIGAKPDHSTTYRLERMLQQQQFACGVDVCSLKARRVPCVSDFDAIHGWFDIMIAGCSDNPAGLFIVYRPGKHVPAGLGCEGGVNIVLHFIRSGNEREEQVPKLTVGCGLPELIGMVQRKRFQPHTISAESYRLHADHVNLPGSIIELSDSGRRN